MIDEKYHCTNSVPKITLDLSNVPNTVADQFMKLSATRRLLIYLKNCPKDLLEFQLLTPQPVVERCDSWKIVIIADAGDFRHSALKSDRIESEIKLMGLYDVERAFGLFIEQVTNLSLLCDRTSLALRGQFWCEENMTLSELAKQINKSVKVPTGFSDKKFTYLTIKDTPDNQKPIGEDVRRLYLACFPSSSRLIDIMSNSEGAITCSPRNKSKH